MDLPDASAVNKIGWLNQLSSTEASNELLKCCGSLRWANQVAEKRPFSSLAELSNIAFTVWWSLDKTDWLEAFRSHPRIGEKKAETKGTIETEKWSEQEQSRVANSSRQTIESLAILNRKYEQKFGYIFIICATGKSSEEISSALRARLQNEPDTEIRIAAAEQSQIMELRLRRLLGEGAY